MAQEDLVPLLRRDLEAQLALWYRHAVPGSTSPATVWGHWGLQDLLDTAMSMGDAASTGHSKTVDSH